MKNGFRSLNVRLRRLPLTGFEKTRQFLSRPKNFAPLSAILALYPVCALQTARRVRHVVWRKNRLSQAFLTPFAHAFATITQFARAIFHIPIFLAFLLLSCGSPSEVLLEQSSMDTPPPKKLTPTNPNLTNLPPTTNTWKTLRRERVQTMGGTSSTPIAPLPPNPNLVEDNPSNPLDAFIQQIVSVRFGEGAGFGQSQMLELLLGPPFGGGSSQGSLDVVSLGNGGEIILGFPNYFPIDGTGSDFIVFENPFRISGTSQSFVEPGIVGASQDGVNFIDFPCTLTSPYQGCAGVNPVFANPEQNTIDPRNPLIAGGNAFDLAEVGLDYALFIRIRDANLNLAGQTAIQAGQAGFDLDAISIVHGARP